MRSANPLTPFDFPSSSPSAILASDAGLSQDDVGTVQPIPAVQLAQFRDVEVVVSRGALAGWVEQASPACGAASVAGAWNAVKPEGSGPLGTTLMPCLIWPRLCLDQAFAFCFMLDCIARSNKLEAGLWSSLCVVRHHTAPH